MRASEIIRKIADVLDAQETNQSSSTEITNRPGQSDVPTGQPADTQGIEGQAHVNTKSMVAPLQQKLDLLKKIAGEDDACPSCGCSPCGCEPNGSTQDSTDELAILKQNAGIKIAAVEASDDEPFEG
jgi:hypothetical protein